MDGHHVVRFVECEVGLYHSTCSSNPVSRSNEPLKHMQLQRTAKEVKAKNWPVVGSFFMTETNSVSLCLQPVNRSTSIPCSSAWPVS